MRESAGRPRLSLRVGITGHRWRESHHAADERLDRSNADDVQRSLRTVFIRVRAAADLVQRRHAGLFSAEPPLLSLVSALAEGADELAAMVASEPAIGFALDIVAPYDLASHATRCAPGTPTRTLWDGARARLILDGVPLADQPQPGERQARHEATLIETNRRLVWNCDLMIAVWDGRDARGDAGTTHVIEHARAEGLPVIHVHSVTPGHVALLDAIGAETFAVDIWSAIDEVVTRLLEAPDSHHAREHAVAGRPRHEAHVRQRASFAIHRALTEYVNESPPGIIVRQLGARVYGVVQWVLAGTGNIASGGAIPKSPDAVAIPWDAIPTALAVSERRGMLIDPAFRRADYFASAYGARHRSTFATILFFAPFAVVCAWAGSVVGDRYKLAFALGELLLLAILTAFFTRSRSLRFHEKWLDYRLLAERIRHLGFLWPLGRSSPVIRVPTHAILTDPRPAWVNWWYRALAREAGLAPVHLDAATVGALANQITHDLVAAQLEYNRSAHEVAHRAEHRLHLMPWIPLLLALGAALGHVLEHLHLLHLEPAVVVALTGIGILGPAFGAALHGFASQAGYQEIGIRTEASAQQLERFAQRLAELDLTLPLASNALGELALSVADVMGEDLAGWRVDYLARPVNPPG
ncbi:MAG: hypothetical protein IPP90_22280 [Gemmatimonadaceae bacterium]|nr:hypothetical protein [Gemmatimonadaceae bacterium]